MFPWGAEWLSGLERTWAFTGSACPRSETCTTHPLWVRISQEMQRTLDTVTLSDLRGGTLSLDH